MVKSRRTSFDSLHTTNSAAVILDVTSGGVEPWNRLSPFYPHGGIPVPFSPGHFSMTVEGIATAKAVRTHSARHPQWHLVNNQIHPVFCGFDSSTKTSIAQSG